MVEKDIGSARFNGCLSGARSDLELANAGPAHQRGQPIASLASPISTFCSAKIVILVGRFFFFESLRKKRHGFRVSQFFRSKYQVRTERPLGPYKKH
jgi:hypothetical protein